MKQDPVSVARAAYDAYVRKDRAAMEAIVADGYRFTSPIDNAVDRRKDSTRAYGKPSLIRSTNAVAGWPLRPSTPASPSAGAVVT